MGIVLQDFPKITNKSEINYEEFIDILSKKANLNRIYKAKIEGEGVEYFEESQGKKIMDLDSVKGLYKLI